MASMYVCTHKRPERLLGRPAKHDNQETAHQEGRVGTLVAVCARVVDDLLFTVCRALHELLQALTEAVQLWSEVHPEAQQWLSLVVT